MKIQINDSNYAHYRKIFEIIQKQINTLLPPELVEHSDPIKVLNNIEVQSKSIARKSLKTGLQDQISQFKELPQTIKVAIDKDLAAFGLPGVADLQGIVEKTVSRVLKRKKIKNQEEYEIIKEEVNDMESDLKAEERILLDEYLSVFESTQAGKI